MPAATMPNASDWTARESAAHSRQHEVAAMPLVAMSSMRLISCGAVSADVPENPFGTDKPKTGSTLIH